MEINGSIESGTIENDVDVDDVRAHLEIMDQDDVENIVSDYLDNRDASAEVEGTVESLLDQYDGNTAPCGLGQTFEKAVWWAMGRRTRVDGDVAEKSDALPDDEYLRKVLREELLAILNTGISQRV